MRDGLNPSRIRLPPGGPWRTVVEYLHERFPGDRSALLDKVRAREVRDEFGAIVDLHTPFRADLFVFLYRDPAPEPRVPFEIEVLHRDDSLLVVDKPHFLATTPRGLFILESAVVRLRRQFGLPELSPVHRLDRMTAGVVVFSVNPTERGAYQTMFARREVRKTYHAVAAVDPDLRFPVTVRSRIIKRRGRPTVDEVPGQPNAVTQIALLDVRDGSGLYELQPETGKTHQLRVHMNGLGLPILGDPFYPRLLDFDQRDYSTPMQLLARTIAFTDPLNGERRLFTSRRSLTGWPAGDAPPSG